MDDTKVDKETSRLWLMAATLYFAAAISTIHLTSNGHDIASIWPANAILVALLLADFRPRWRTVLSAGFLANIAANLITRGTLAGPILYGLANLIEVALAVWLLQKTGGREGLLQSTSAVLRFIVIAGILAPVASGVVGGLTAFIVFGEPLLKSFGTWIASDALGLLVFTPFLTAAFRGEFVLCFTRMTWWERVEAGALIALAGAVAYIVFFYATRPLLFAVFAPLMLITFRVGRLGVKAAVMLIATIGGIATMKGQGPVILIAADATSQAQAFQAFLAVVLMICLPVAAEVSKRTLLTAALAAHAKEMTTCALTDPLTGILNRRGFEIKVGNLLQSEIPTSVSLVVLDIDHFKQINDRWGHPAGDRALQHLAPLLLAHVREEDLVGRLGGDEFAILLPNTDLELAKEVAERIRAGVHASPLSIDESSTVFISISIGISLSSSNDDYERLAQSADQALYNAKKCGRNTISWVT